MQSNHIKKTLTIHKDKEVYQKLLEIYYSQKKYKEFIPLKVRSICPLIQWIRIFYLKFLMQVNSKETFLLQSIMVNA